MRNESKKKTAQAAALDPLRCPKTIRVLLDEKRVVRCAKKLHEQGFHVGWSPEEDRNAKVVFFADGRLATDAEVSVELARPARNLCTAPAPKVVVAPEPPLREVSSKAAAVAEAKSYGYTGDPCPKCGSLKVIRTGTCGTCTACGEPGSCG